MKYADEEAEAYVKYEENKKKKIEE